MNIKTIDPRLELTPTQGIKVLSFISTINGTKQCTCNNAHTTKHMQQSTCNNAHAAILFDKQTNKQMCLVCFKEYQTNKVGMYLL